MAWCDLPIDLLCFISSHLSIVDLVRLSVVCTSWNFTLANYALIGFQCRPSPWLLLSNDIEEDSDTLTFCELTIEEEEAVISFHRHFSSIGSHTYGRRYFGSNDGWLVTLDKIDLQPRLFNPVTKAEISLPSLFTLIELQYSPDGSTRILGNETLFDIMTENLRDIYFHKIIVSSNDSYGTAVVIYGIKKELALAKSEALTWVLGPQLSPYSTEDTEQFEDVYYHDENQLFYAITNFSLVLSFDLNGQNVELISPNMPNSCYRTRHFDCMYYIAFLSGTLLKIERVIDITPNSPYNTTTMAIFVSKFVPVVVASSSSSYSQWMSVNDMGEYSFFVGCNQTFSLHHKVATGIKPNCIYFSDHSSNMLPGFVDCDVGLFDLYNDRIQYILPPYSRTNWPPSIWFTPSLS
ncbi:F-box protein SKIP23-like [Dendrobium catenatum]|uniref:F-box protein SKIP23-like n=1 Tax=Dendrobium catenatum TaxID=906689 RepID=UPI0009F469DE|nr:F-box protein SKIP23-like [Dendrobium catenatum]